MHRTRFERIGLLICVALASVSALAQDPPQPLTLEECVNQALAHGFAMKIEGQQLAIERESLPIAESEFQPVAGASMSKSVTRSPNGSDDSSLTNRRSDQTLSRVELAKRLRTGTQVGLSANLDHSVDPLTAEFNPAYASDLAVTFSQPLLRGFGPRITLLPVRVAGLDISAAERSYESRALEVIENTERAYYSLAGAREQLAVFDSSLELSQALLREAQSRQASGMATGQDVRQAQLNVKRAELNIEDGRKTVRDSQDRLRALMGAGELDKPIGAIVLSSDPADLPTENESFELAKQRSPELHAAQVALDIADLSVTAAEDDLKPFVSLDGAFGLLGADKNRSDAFSHSLQGDGTAWQVGLSVTFPIGRVAEKARLRRSRAAQTRETFRLEEIEQDILVQVREAVSAVLTRRKSLDIAAEAVDLSQSQYDDERKRFRAGISTSRLVREAQIDLEVARLTHLQSRLDLLSARAALQRIEGSGLARYAVKLPEPQGSPSGN